MKESEQSLLVIGVGGAGEAIVGRWAKTHADAGVRFVVGPSEPTTLERAAGVVVVVGLGGREGGPRALLEVARAKARGISTTVLAILPFTFEGRGRRRRAQEALTALQATADALRVFDNDSLLCSDEETLDLEGAYRACDDQLWSSLTRTT
jgi:cell division GTPase FtsZ